MATTTAPKKRGIKPGTKFSPEWRENMSKAQKRSPKARAHLKTLQVKGKAPSDEALAGSMATRALRRMGLTREGSPQVWDEYMKQYLKRLKERSRSQDSA